MKYDRQTRIPGWDQNQIEHSSVALVGAGALGNHVAIGLIGLGVGTIKIYDYDDIEPHNLNRQSLFCESDIGKNKAEALAARLQERNSSILAVGINEKIQEDTVDTIIGEVDVIIDCVDRIYVRKILNRYALFADIPMVHGGISWMGGQTGILTRMTPCVNCIYPDDLQKTELQEETSCTRKPEPSLVYTSQIIAGFMVEQVRQLILPLNDDPEHLIGLYKLDFRFHPPFYFEPTTRKPHCDCVRILKSVAPEVLKNEKQNSLKKQNNDNQELKSFLESQK